MRGSLCFLSSLKPCSPWCGHTDSGGTQHDVFFRFLYVGDDREPVTSGDEEGELSVDDLDTSLYVPTPTKALCMC